MLILTRLRGESIFINENIKVTVLEVVGGRVSLAFEAPKEVNIVREELLEED